MKAMAIHSFCVSFPKVYATIRGIEMPSKNLSHRMHTPFSHSHFWLFGKAQLNNNTISFSISKLLKVCVAVGPLNTRSFSRSFVRNFQSQGWNFSPLGLIQFPTVCVCVCLYAFCCVWRVIAME